MPSEEKKEPAKESSQPLLSRLKISKKAYVFDIRRKYSTSRNFLVKKAAENPADDIKEKLAEIFSRKKPIGDDERKETRDKIAKDSNPAKKGAPSHKSSSLFAAIAVVLLLILGSVIFVFMQLGQIPASPELPRTAVYSGKHELSVEETGMLSLASGGGYARTPYLLLNYKTENLASLKVELKIFQQKPPTQVFLLDYERDGADSYPAFRNRLFSGLKNAGMPINEIDVARLASIPSGATVIVPTGLLPHELADNEGGLGYKQILARGSNIIYIGYPFDKEAINSDGSTSEVKKSEISFAKSAPPSAEGFRLYDARYTASPTPESGMAGSGMLYGSISTIRYGGGTMLLLPQTLDGGWRGDGEAAADDVVMLIKEQQWLTPLSSSNVALPVVAPGKEGKASVFMPSLEQSGGFVQLAEEATDTNSITLRSVRIFQMQKTEKGEMSPRDPVAAPTYLSGQKTRLTIDLHESSPTPVKLYVQLYKDGNLTQQDEMEFGLTNPTLEKPKDMAIDAPPGKYVVRVEDGQGKVYASTSLDVSDLDIGYETVLWSQGKFSFLLSSAGQPAVPRSLSISLDGKQLKTYYPQSFSYKEGKTAVAYDYTGELKPGTHEFVFSAGAFSKKLPVDYRVSKQLWERPELVVMFLLALGITGIGVMLRRNEAPRFGLDIPDFPPLSTIKIPVKRETVLGIFNDVNAGYSWQFMPLRTDEIKTGFRRLTYNGKPILIGDFNLDRVLARLRDEGLVKEDLGYFGLSQWEKESGRTIRYLTAYRILRNVFVNNAVKFSKLGAMPDCDIKAIAGKEEIYLHIMDSKQGATNAGDSAPQRNAEETVHRALATAKRGTTIIVFGSEEERDSFATTLTSTSKLAVALKMEVNSGNLLLLPVKNAISAYLKGIVK